MPALPNCIVIGAMKAGTTSLHNYLGLHPDIFASEVKEINFFVKEQTWKKGLDWYRNQFDATYKIRLESSQNYTKRHVFQGVPQRIKETLGENVKFIYILRDPIKRMISHYLERLTAGHVENNIDFNEALLNYMDSKSLSENHIVQTSLYNYQLQPYYELFPKENFHILRLEDLNKNPLIEINKIFTFLGLDSISETGAIKQYNRSTDKYYYPIWFIRLKEQLYKVPGGGRIISLLMNQSIFTKRVDIKKTKLDDAVLNELSQIFRKDDELIKTFYNY